jgi:hypothetical protein
MSGIDIAARSAGERSGADRPLLGELDARPGQSMSMPPFTSITSPVT